MAGILDSVSGHRRAQPIRDHFEPGIVKSVLVHREDAGTTAQKDFAPSQRQKSAGTAKIAVASGKLKIPCPNGGCRSFAALPYDLKVQPRMRKWFDTPKRAAIAATIAIGLACLNWPSGHAPAAAQTSPPTDQTLARWQFGEAQFPAKSARPPRIDCTALRSVRLPLGATVAQSDMVADAPGKWCSVRIEVRRDGARAPITIWAGLPIDDWNGRFLGLGGGGYVTGGPSAIASAVRLGFATASTNSGHVDTGNRDDADNNPFQLSFDGSFAVDADGRPDRSAIRDFAHAGTHRMTVIGKALTAAFYGTTDHRSYFVGCSGGGRQGQVEVQRYPGDYDGVLSGAPAINWSRWVPATLWPQLAMRDVRPVAQCKFEAARRAAVAACDKQDGAEDGLVSDIAGCAFDARALIGRPTGCGPIEPRDAEVIRRIWDGPRGIDGRRLWYALDRTAALSFAAATAGDPLQGRAAPLAKSWYRHFLLRRADLNQRPPTHAEFERLFARSATRFTADLGGSPGRISAFERKGGKTIIWHGLADEVIPAGGSIAYVNAIRETLGGKRSDGFLRLYLAPGVGHCFGGDGPAPTGLLKTLTDWVEHRRAPGAVTARLRNADGSMRRTRPLCPYPQRQAYLGGPVDQSASFACRDAAEVDTRLD